MKILRFIASIFAAVAIAAASTNPINNAILQGTTQLPNLPGSTLLQNNSSHVLSPAGATNGVTFTNGNVVPVWASAADITNSLNIACWGDSLTFGANATSQDFSFPSDLTKTLGYFTYNGGVGGNTSAQILTRMNAAPSMFGYPTAIWAGRNDVSQSVPQATTLANIASMIGNLNSNRYVVLSVPNANLSNEWSGTATYNTIIALNGALSSAYGANYLDVRTYLVSLYNPALPQDVIDHGNDVPPTSLREMPVVSVSSLTSSSTTATCTCSAAPNPVAGIAIGSTILITGASPSGYNGLVTIVTTNGTTQFTYTLGSTLSSPATGTITAGFVDPLHYNNAGYAAVASYITAHLPALQGNYPSVMNAAQVINYFSSPPIIGALVPNTGDFTNITLTSTTGGLKAPGISLTPAFGGNSPEISLTQNGVTQTWYLLPDGSGWYTTGRLIPNTDNSYDLGFSSSALRWRNGFFSGGLTAAGTVTGNFLVSTGGFIQATRNSVNRQLSPTNDGAFWETDSSWIPKTDASYDLGTITDGTFRWLGLYITGQAQIGTLQVKSGSNAKSGTFTLASGVATVSNTGITNHSVIHASLQSGSSSGSITGPVWYPTVTAGMGFTVAEVGGTSDNSVYNYWIEENN